MTLHALLAYVSAGLSSLVLLLVLSVRQRSIVHWTFAAGMGFIVLMEVCMGVHVQATEPTAIVSWKYWSYTAAAFLPGSWLLFSLCFVRTQYSEMLVRWKYGILATFVCPVFLVALGPQALFVSLVHDKSTAHWFLPLGWAGYLLHVCFLLSAVVILMHLERTLRAVAGHTRWQVKFMILGLGTFFAAQIYTSSQALLFSAVDVVIESINAYAIILANGLMMISLVRNRYFNVPIYLSRTLLHSSITVAAVGIYLLAVGLLTKIINYAGSDLNLPVGTFFVFVALLGLTVILLSDELRHHMKHFVSRNFYRSRYDYRQEWMAFTARTATVVHVEELCAVSANMLAETFGVPAVTIWLGHADHPEQVTIGASTVWAEERSTPPEHVAQGLLALVQYMREESMPVDVETSMAREVRDLRQRHAQSWRAAHIRYGVSLVVGAQWLGFISLSERHTQEPYTLEDAALFKTMADQTAAKLLNLQLLQRVVHAKQMETWQTLSAFFVHDLKNLAAKLSLMVQNLPLYYDNPEFRGDAFQVIASSVEKMNTMCGRLSLVGRELDLHCTAVDLNELVQTAIADLHGSLHATLTYVPGPEMVVWLDPEQIRKVLENLLLNAHEAMDTPGCIRIETAQQERWAVLTVSDNGRGMTRTFMERSLFRPLHTTKSQGLGIGLFHSRTIVEAHHGRIDVESAEGQGSTFRVYLPVKG